MEPAMKSVGGRGACELGYRSFRDKFILSRGTSFTNLALKNEEYSPKVLIFFTR